MNIINFAYGSNMLLSRIEERVGTVKRLGVYKLTDWKLVFNAGFGAYANIERSKGSFVEGIMYSLTPYQVLVLDRYENYPLCYRKNHFILPDKREFFAYVANPNYISNPRWKVKPTLTYLNILLDGSYENNLKDTYHALIEYKKNNYKLKKGSKHKYI